VGILDEVISMKSRGISDSEVIKNLREQGISPSEINEALNRAQIKSAVSADENSKTNSEGMEQSIMNSEEEPDHLPTEGDINDFDLTPPPVSGFKGRLTKEIPENSEEIYEPQEAYYPQQQYLQEQGGYAPAPQPGYEQQEYSESMGSIDTDTIIEISEQVVSEKNRPIQKKIEEMEEFRVLTQTRIDYISDRLKKIETIIDKLQAAILEKIGSYGQGIENVKKEMNMMQGSFSKMVNNLADRADEKYSRQNKSTPVEEEDSNSSDIPINNPKKVQRKVSKR
jgi:hypothetical protein